MKNLFLFLIASTAFCRVLEAQPQPCALPEMMTSTCLQACIICDIDGFTGVNNSNIQGQAPPGFCTTVVHHMQWIGFIAGSTNLTLEVQVGNCQGNDGLEIGIYKSLDCQTFQLVSNCDTDVDEFSTGVFTNTVPLEIGQYYYFVMDGSNNDICQYTVHVVDGTTEVMPLFDSGVVEGESLVCTGSTATYSILPPLGAAAFQWTVNGSPVSQDTFATINWPNAGAYNVCVTASNVCDTAPPSCRIVHVKSIAPTVIPAKICQGDCYQEADSLLCTAGSYEFHYYPGYGCDSMVTINLSVLPEKTTFIDLNICAGDSIVVGNTAYKETGQYTEILDTYLGCDSTVNLNLFKVICEITGDVLAADTGCHGDSSGVLIFQVLQGTPPFTYSWTRIGMPGPSGTGALSGLATSESIQNLPAGLYAITVNDNFGNDLILLTTLKDPPPLVATSATSVYNGFEVSCAGGADGFAQALPGGGTPPYAFQWSGGPSQTATLSPVPAGQYTVTVTDAKNCQTTATATLTEPPPLQLSVALVNPGCAGPNTGSIHINSYGGGIMPYSFALNSGIYGTALDFAGLGGGNYTVSIKDGNSCTYTENGTLIPALIPEIDLGDDIDINLGEHTSLQLLTNIPLDSIHWQPATGLDCTECPRPEALPVHTTTYTATASSVDGCIDTDSVTVRVTVIRRVYVPNGFSPDDDGVNDYFLVFAGPEAVNIKHLDVYSRWGELVFSSTDAIPNAEKRGWDGTFRGRPMNADVFVWFAEVEFLDGVTQTYKGDVSLIR